MTQAVVTAYVVVVRLMLSYNMKCVHKADATPEAFWVCDAFDGVVQCNFRISDPMTCHGDFIVLPTGHNVESTNLSTTSCRLLHITMQSAT